MALPFPNVTANVSTKPRLSLLTPLDAAVEMMNDGEVEKALETFNVILKTQPGNAEVYKMRAEAFWRMKNAQNAYDDLCRALSLTPDEPDLLFRRGTLLAMSTHWDEGLADINRFLEMVPQHLEGHLRRYWIYVQKQNREEAQEELDGIMESLPDTPSELFLTSVYLLETGRADKAKDLLSDILDAEPQNIAALRYRGLAWRLVGASDMSIRDYDTLLQLQADDAGALFERALSYIELGKRTLFSAPFHKAVADLTRIIDEMPEKITNIEVVYNSRGSARFHIAHRAWFNKNGYKNALEDYSDALAKKPDFIEALFNRATLNRQLKFFEQAAADCTRILELQPHNTAALELRAQTYRKMRQDEQAAADFQTLDAVVSGKPD